MIIIVVTDRQWLLFVSLLNISWDYCLAHTQRVAYLQTNYQSPDIQPQDNFITHNCEMDNVKAWQALPPHPQGWLK